MIKRFFLTSLVAIRCISFLCAEDNTSLEIFLGSGREKIPVHFVVTDTQGRREGRTSKNSIYLGEQPDAYYGVESLPGVDLRKSEKSIRYDRRSLSSGIYTITIYGIDTSTYNLRILSTNFDRKENFFDQGRSEHIISSGKTAEYKIYYDRTPNGKLTTFEKVVTFDTLRQDLQAAKELKAIKSEELFNRLMEKINTAEKQAWSEKQKSLESLAEELKTQPKKIFHPQVSAIIQQDVQTLLKNLK